MIIYPEALGTWALSDESYWGVQEKRDSKKTLEAALALGIRHFDTAQAYGSGKAEQLLGWMLASHQQSHPRDSLFLATKIHTFHPDRVEKQLEISLRRLNTSYLDLVYLHWPRKEEDIRPVYDSLYKAVEKGVVRFLGTSNLPLSMLKQAVKAAPIAISQFAYSLLWRYPEQDIIPFCKKHNIAAAAYSPLAQ
ncbi:MAG: aldo/keto reductase, partial [Spirochaetales bacterium]|nr:aldo/keto reductase [Spirochaetales bacterium]